MSGVANEWETVNRYVKARKIADVLVAAGITDADRIDDPTSRRLVVEITGVNDPSEVTWALVKHLVKEGR